MELIELSDKVWSDTATLLDTCFQDEDENNKILTMLRALDSRLYEAEITIWGLKDSSREKSLDYMRFRNEKIQGGLIAIPDLAEYKKLLTAIKERDRVVRERVHDYLIEFPDSHLFVKRELCLAGLNYLIDRTVLRLKFLAEQTVFAKRLCRVYIDDDVKLYDELSEHFLVFDRNGHGFIK